MKVFYHADLDGECAAAVVLWSSSLYQGFAHKMLDECEAIPLDYKDEFPFDRIGKQEHVWIVDFSLQRPGDWERLLAKTRLVTWCDHHRTAIERANEIPEVKALPGSRADTRPAGCELAWECWWAPSGGQPIPYGLQLIGDYDTWTFEHGDDTRRFQAYLTTMVDTRPTSNLWPLLLEDDNFSYINTLEMGRQVLEKRVLDAAENVASWGFDVYFEGLRGIALNRRGINSSFFDSVASDYDLLLPFAFDGKQWTVSIYRGGRQPNLDCSEIAKRYGGGGHPGASGFQCTTLPWIPMEKLP